MMLAGRLPALLVVFVFFAGGGAAAAEEPMSVAEELDAMSLYFSEDQLVEAPTRHPKPVSQVAENVTIITAGEIEAMGAHTVAEVLNRVAGLIVDGSYQDFVSPASVLIHGSEYEHILVLIDGVRWGYVSFDLPETNTIPVQIIKRIEVIKGAASSSWGSSLGGVVNIITKDAGSSDNPSGLVSAGYGEYGTSDFRAEAAGRLGRVGYYLYGGYQGTDGLRDGRFLDNRSFYGKLRLPLPHAAEAEITAGYSRPEYRYLFVPAWDAFNQGASVFEDEAVFVTANVSAPLTDTVTVNVSGFRYDDTATDIWRHSVTKVVDARFEYDGRSTGLAGRLVWSLPGQTVVVGAETERRENTDKDLAAPYIAPTNYEGNWAVFVNDTINRGRLTVTPGIRYDSLSIAEDVISPSLGVTYLLREDTLFRVAASHGFRKPYSPIKQGDPYFNITNPDLEAETIWSYQAGVETSAIPFLRFKATGFYHLVDDEWDRDPNTWAFVNGRDFQRHGVEAEVWTMPFHNVVLEANGTMIRMDPQAAPDDSHYLANLLVEYDDGIWQAQLLGHNAWIGDVSPPVVGSEQEIPRFMWNAVVSRRLDLGNHMAAEVFLALHNLFDAEHYLSGYYPNAPRWLEGGVRLFY